MNDSRDSDDACRSNPPLWSIGLAVTVILVAPLILYSLAPSGPLRAGDTIFSEGQQRVPIALPVPTSGPLEHATCLLDPGNPLIILESPLDRTDGAILATAQGNPVAEWPFCQPRTQVLIKTHQMFQKPDLWDAPKRGLARLFRD